MDGKTIISNTRTSTTLINAGVPKSQWNGVNTTGKLVPGGGGATFEDLVKNQLSKNMGGPYDW